MQIEHRDELEDSLERMHLFDTIEKRDILGIPGCQARCFSFENALCRLPCVDVKLPNPSFSDNGCISYLTIYDVRNGARQAEAV